MFSCASGGRFADHRSIAATLLESDSERIVVARDRLVDAGAAMVPSMSRDRMGAF